jgi:DNA-binding NarL/FixJ family response regulator
VDTKTHLGDAAFAAASEAGQRLAWHELLAEIDALIEALPEIRTGTPATPASTHGLSRREVEVLQMLVEGQSNRSIAEALSLSERTIQNHVFHIFNKLGVNTRAAAAAHAVRHDLI